MTIILQTLQVAIDEMERALELESNVVFKILNRKGLIIMKTNIIKNVNTLKAMARRGFITYPVDKGHYYVDRKENEKNYYGFTYKGKHYQIKYYPGCFYPFVVKTD